MENLPLINLVDLYSPSGRIALEEKKMADHSWVLGVLDDLSEYALKNNIPDLEANIRAAALSAKTEISALYEKSEPSTHSKRTPFSSSPN